MCGMRLAGLLRKRNGGNEMKHALRVSPTDISASRNTILPSAALRP